MPVSGNCTSVEYGDPFDVMGDQSAMRHMNNYHKRQLNWMTSVNVQDIASDGIYNLANPEQSSAAVQVIRLIRNVTGNVTRDYYYLEYRRPYGVFDNFPASDPVVNGISIRIAPPFTAPTQSKIIDTTENTATFGDASLGLGRICCDGIFNISVTALAINS